jgi:hypothetical protein
MITDLLTWANFFGIMGAVLVVCVIADKLGWWE